MDSILVHNSYADLAQFRKELGLPKAGSSADKSTIAMIDINGQKIFGINGHGQKVNAKVNAISKTHAEIDVLNQIKTKKINVQDKDLVLHVDRDPCKACGQNGGIKSMATELKLKSLTIISPSGKTIIVP